MAGKRNGFDTAWRLHGRASNEFAAAVAKRDRDGIRQAAEKGWLAVVEATKALLRARGVPVPGGTGRQRDTLVRFGREDRRAKKLYLLFSTAREILHIACFYDDEVHAPTIETVLADTSEFIGLAERFAAGAK